MDYGPKDLERLVKLADFRTHVSSHAQPSYSEADLHNSLQKMGVTSAQATQLIEDYTSGNLTPREQEFMRTAKERRVSKKNGRWRPLLYPFHALRSGIREIITTFIPGLSNYQQQFDEILSQYGIPSYTLQNEDGLPGTVGLVDKLRDISAIPISDTHLVPYAKSVQYCLSQANFSVQDGKDILGTISDCQMTPAHLSTVVLQTNTYILELRKHSQSVKIGMKALRKACEDSSYPISMHRFVKNAVLLLPLYQR